MESYIPRFELTNRNVYFHVEKNFNHSILIQIKPITLTFNWYPTPFKCMQVVLKLVYQLTSHQVTPNLNNMKDIGLNTIGV